jgi:choice-of-anchor I-like protein
VNRYLVPIVVAVAVLGAAAPAEAHGGSHGHRPRIALSVLGTYHTDVFDASAAEIVAHDPRTQRLFVVNAAAAQVEVLDIDDPAAPELAFTLRTAEAVGDPGAAANSVAVRHDGLVAVAVESGTKTDPGWVVFYDRHGRLLNVLPAGALPDMLTFTPDGRTLLVANEGEPADDFGFDPEGSVSVIDVSKRITSLTARQVRTANFRAWDRGWKDLPRDVRVFGPDVTGRADGGLDEPGRIARNLEPEYIVVDGSRAYATLQEASAVAVLDIRTARFVDIRPFGFKDHLLPGNELDVSDQDGTVRLANWPVYGVYQPDATASYRWRSRTLLVTANEGDAREWGDYVEPARLRGLTGGTPLCADSPRLQGFLAGNDLGITTVDQLRDNANLGRLNVTTASGLRADGSCYEDVYAFGGRSFSIWTTGGHQLFDSGADFERLTAEAYPDSFNANNTGNGFDSRSDDKGPEPEGLTVGRIAGHTYAFIGFERIGGIVVYDITDPRAAFPVQYLNHRDFAAEPGTRAAGDLGPEGLLFIGAEDSPAGVPLLAVANEVSGTTTLLQLSGR